MMLKRHLMVGLMMMALLLLIGGLAIASPWASDNLSMKQKVAVVSVSTDTSAVQTATPTPVPPEDPILDLTVYIQGYYLGSANQRLATVDVELRDPGDCTTVLYTYNDIDLDASGMATFELVGAADGYYYVSVNHFNHLHVITQSTYLFQGGVTTTVYFPGPGTTAPGDQITVMGVEAMRGGDADDDCIVFVSDYSTLALQWNTPGPEADFDGDGLVFVGDYSILAMNWNQRCNPCLD